MRHREPVQLLMPPTLTNFQRETLEACLPDNVSILYLEADEWVQAEQFIFLPTIAAGLDFPLIPSEYFAHVRQRIFRRYNISGKHGYTKKILHLARQGQEAPGSQ